jgi:hypothetical protein
MTTCMRGSQVYENVRNMMPTKRSLALCRRRICGGGRCILDDHAYLTTSYVCRRKLDPGRACV